MATSAKDTTNAVEKNRKRKAQPVVQVYTLMASQSGYTGPPITDTFRRCPGKQGYAQIKAGDKQDCEDGGQGPRTPPGPGKAGRRKASPRPLCCQHTGPPPRAEDAPRSVLPALVPEQELFISVQEMPHLTDNLIFIS